MAKLFVGALGALAVMTVSTAFAAGYGQPYTQSYNRGYIPGPYVPPALQQQRQNAQPRYAPAQPRTPAPAPLPNPDDPATKVSKQLANLRAFLEQAQDLPVDPVMAMEYIETQVAPDIDFPTMTRMALGRLAHRMSPQQRAQAEDALRTNFITKLVDAMGSMRTTGFTVGRTRPGTSRGELVVPVRLDRWQGQPLTINFRFYKTQSGWKVFDAEANGQSAVLFYRGYFARQWRAGR